MPEPRASSPLYWPLARLRAAYARGDLLGHPVHDSPAAMRDAAAALHALGPRYVLVKGGHGSGDTLVDVLYDGARALELPAQRIRTRNTHGTGCTLSSAIAALAPQCPTVEAAVRDARAYVLEAIRRADELQVGGGHGPLHHFHTLWPRMEAPA